MLTLRILMKETSSPIYYRQAVEEYTKRLGRYCNLSLEPVKESDLEAALASPGYMIRVSQKGRQMDSVAFAQQLDSLATQGVSKITFVLNMKCPAAQDTLSLTTISLEDPLHLVALLEQIYRSFRITNGEPYHK
jgi:23S rRNA (pseudouridine1915-N3)-methyltransferase